MNDISRIARQKISEIIPGDSTITATWSREVPEAIPMWEAHVTHADGTVEIVHVPYDDMRPNRSDFRG